MPLPVALIGGGGGALTVLTVPLPVALTGGGED